MYGEQRPYNIIPNIYFYSFKYIYARKMEILKWERYSVLSLLQQV